MNVEIIYPFLLLIAPFVMAFFLESLVIYFFRLESFGKSLVLSLLLNLASLLFLYVNSMVVGKLGYAMNSLQLPLQVVFFFWWLSILADGFLLQLFAKKAGTQQLYVCSLVMNTVSYLFISIFIRYSH